MDKKGFTILEILVVIFIVSLGLVGVLSVSVQNLQVQYINKSALVASQLAQEGLELVRNKRDNNWLISGNDWVIGAGAYSDSDIVQDGDYAIDYSGDIYEVDSIDDARLYIDADGFYTHDSSGTNETIFYRFIEVDDNTDYIEVYCTVKWKEKNQEHEYVATYLLYDWR